MNDTPEDDDARLVWLEGQAEAAYGRMYDASNPTTAAACYNDAKELLSDALGLARRLDDADAIARLQTRLAHIKAVFRSQFS